MMNEQAFLSPDHCDCPFEDREGRSLPGERNLVLDAHLEGPAQKRHGADLAARVPGSAEERSNIHESLVEGFGLLSGQQPLHQVPKKAFAGTFPRIGLDGPQPTEKPLDVGIEDGGLLHMPG
jgi:hypothetical protein